MSGENSNESDVWATAEEALDEFHSRTFPGPSPIPTSELPEWEGEPNDFPG